jgi:hypothetical protein
MKWFHRINEGDRVPTGFSLCRTHNSYLQHTQVLFNVFGITFEFAWWKRPL